MGLRPQGLGGSFWAIIGATFLGFLGIGTVLPGLGPHVRFDLGGSDQMVGFVIGIFSLVALGSRFFSGPLTDRRGRKTSFQIGLVSCALSGCAYLLPVGLAGAFLARTLQGFGEACLYTGAAAWAVEVAGVERSGQALGYVSSGIWGGISAGPVIGHALGSFQRAAMMQSVAAAVAFLILLRIPEHYRPALVAKRRVWGPRSLLAPGIAIGFVNVHYPVVAGFLILFLSGHGNSGPAAFTGYAAMVLLSRFFLGGLPDRIHPAITYYAGIAATAIGLLTISTGPRPAVAIGATALLGLRFSFPWASVAGTVLRQTPSHERGSVIGILSAFYDLFVGVSSFAAGIVSSHYGYAAAFLMAAVALLAAAGAGPFVFPKGFGTRAIPAGEVLTPEVG